MKIDRSLQWEILQYFERAYPNYVTLARFYPASPEDVEANLQYLAEHQLLDWKKAPNSTLRQDYGWKITAKGLDFMMNDGGLSAILNVVTVRFEAQSLKALLEASIRKELPEEEQQKYVDALDDLSAEATRSLVEQVVGLVVEKSVQAGPFIVQFLSRFFT